MRNYQNLEVWKVSMQVAKEVFILTKSYPKEELYGLTSQTKRAAISISANIAEGTGRQYKKDTIQFLHIARGSVYELESLLLLAKDVIVLDHLKLQDILLLIDQTIKLLNGLINYTEKASLK